MWHQVPNECVALCPNKLNSKLLSFFRTLIPHNEDAHLLHIRFKVHRLWFGFIKIIVTLLTCIWSLKVERVNRKRARIFLMQQRNLSGSYYWTFTEGTVCHILLLRSQNILCFQVVEFIGYFIYLSLEQSFFTNVIFSHMFDLYYPFYIAWKCDNISC